MKRHSLQAEIRTVLGHKVKSLRREGKLPATVYGKTTESFSVSIPMDAFVKVYREAGQTGLIDLKVDSQSHPVLIHHVQFDPVARFPLNVEFHQVNLKEKVKANVPLVFEGEPAAVKEKLGMLLTLVDEIEVETLPDNIPEHVIVDVSKLAALDEQITVADLSIPTDVIVITDGAIMVAKIGELAAPEPEPVAEAAAPAEGEAAATPAATEPPAAE